jgi:hypothetical protein
VLIIELNMQTTTTTTPVSTRPAGGTPSGGGGLFSRLSRLASSRTHHLLVSYTTRSLPVEVSFSESLQDASVSKTAVSNRKPAAVLIGNRVMPTTAPRGSSVAPVVNERMPPILSASPTVSPYVSGGGGDGFATPTSRAHQLPAASRPKLTTW